MNDSEKIIKGLETCIDIVPGKYTCNECPYEIDGNCCEIHLAKDALTMLKEKQEAVHVTQRKVMHMLVWCCGSCGVTITDGDKFCRMCGKPVKWNEQNLE